MLPCSLNIFSNNVDLGTACGKYCPAGFSLSIADSGDSDIITTAPGATE
jgi:ribosomal protein L30E